MSKQVKTTPDQGDYDCLKAAALYWYHIVLSDEKAAEIVARDPALKGYVGSPDHHMDTAHREIMVDGIFLEVLGEGTLWPDGKAENNAFWARFYGAAPAHGYGISQEAAA